MKQTAKKILTIIVTVCLLFSLFVFNASAAGSTVAFSKSKLTVGETLTVTARFSTSSSNPMYGLECFVTYDHKVLDFVKTDDNVNKITDGKLKVVLQSAEQVNLSQIIKFKALKVGSSVISVESIVYADKNDIEQTLSGTGATVTVISASEKASSDANLKALSVSAGTLTPAFSPNITSYNVTIPYSETEFWVQATKSHSKATYVVQGSKDMKVGNNKRVVVVTAENGTTKSYTINIIRLDQNGNQVTEDPDPTDENRIEVAIGEEIKYIGEDFASDIIPAGFKVIDYVYEDKTVAAIENDEYVMLYLVDPKTDKGDFYIIGSDNAFTELIKIEVGGQIYYILPTEKVPEGCQAVSGCDINGVLVNAFKHSDPAYADFYTIYALGPQGNIGFYNYDTVEKTIQRSLGLGVTLPEQQEQETETTFLENILAMNLSEKIVAITIILIILLLIAAIIVLIVKIASSGEKKPKEKVEEIDDSQSVGFEYVSVKDPSEKPIVPIENPEFEITPKTEETVSLEDIEEDKE